MTELKKLHPGDPFPEFSLPDASGTLHSLAQYEGKYVVLYAYPKDDTPGCTKEACDFRDNAVLKAHGAVVLGISADDADSHRKFAEKFSLPFPLLSDHWPHGEVTSAYGVFDETHGHPKRSSYVIGRDGNVAWAVHNAPGDARDLDEQADRLAALV